MQRQRLITTIKNVTDVKKAQKLNFIVPVKLTSTKEGGKKRKKKYSKQSIEQVKT